MTPFRLAIATVVATFALLLAGGMVNPTGSSLACPDWPLCHGQVFPAFTGGVQFEHSHRLAAAAVTLTTLLLVLACWRTKSTPRRARRLATGLLPLIALQAALGAITVKYKLVTLVSTAHLAISMAFFLLAITCAFWLWPGMGSGQDRPAIPRIPAIVALTATYAQIVLGGFVRHTGAGRACGLDFPQCGGEWWPDLWAARANMAHRFGGVTLAVIVATCSFLVVRRAAASGRRLALSAAIAAPVLVIVQVLLGIVVVTSGIGFWQIMAHFTTAILLLASWHVANMGLGPRGPLVVRAAR